MPPLVTITSTGVTECLVRNRARMLRLADLRPELDEGVRIIHEHTREWYDSQGDGSWPELAESTVQRKASQGAAEPSRPLYFEGNLYESVTSDAGPYSFRHDASNVEDQSVVIGADWDEGGWQIPVVLSEGSDDERIPARPIWPAEGSHADSQIRADVGAEFMAALR